MPASSQKRDPRQDFIQENRNSLEFYFLHCLSFTKLNTQQYSKKGIYLVIVITSLIIGNIFKTQFEICFHHLVMFTKLNIQQIFKDLPCYNYHFADNW